MINNQITQILSNEIDRLNTEIEMIASENYPSQDILDLLGSHFSVKYAEGYPNKRHYAGCEYIDEIETLCIEKAKELFNVNFANVQPQSGSHANTCVYHAFCKPGDKTLSMSLASGSHLTHGSKFTYSGRFYENHSYTLINEEIDYDEIKKRLYEVKPRMLITGYSAYSKKINFKKIREIVDEYNKMSKEDWYKEREAFLNDTREWYGAGQTKEESWDKNHPFLGCILWCDMAHFAGFVAAHVWKDEYDPTKWCDVISSTTHKTLRGPRSGLILWNNPEYTAKINQSVFPGNGGGPNEAGVAAKAQCFIEALQPEYKEYIKNVYYNMQSLISGIRAVDTKHKIRIISGKSENHLLLLDLKNTGLTGKEAEDKLKSYKIVTNKNMIEGDENPTKSSGLRLGTAAITTRGFDREMCQDLGRIIASVILGEDEFYVPEDTIAFNKHAIRSKIQKMLTKVGPFYKGEAVEYTFNTDPA